MIRKVKESDLNQIMHIHDLYTLDVEKVDERQYQEKVEKEGFTVSTGESNLLNRIKESLIFNVCETDNEIVGYIDVDKEIYFPEEANNIIWENPNIKNIYFHDNTSVSLHHIAVLPKHKHKGIASKLLVNAIKQLKKLSKEHLFAIVTTGPVTNYPSIAFHKKMGFEQVCQTQPIDLFGLKNYESVLFYKKL